MTYPQKISFAELPQPACATCWSIAAIIAVVTLSR